MVRTQLHPLERSVLQVVKEYGLINTDSRILVAVSGGPDSITLLLLLKKLFPTCIGCAAYINHNLRPDDAAREKHRVQTLCRSLDIDFSYGSVDVPREIKETGDSPEDCARRLRYHALHSIRKGKAATALAVGHTRDDQVEEVLIRLIRGSSMKGLAGMGYKNGEIIRPLLDSSKQDLLNYLRDNNQDYCIDKSNQSPMFLRNRIRHNLLPLLEDQFNPSIRSNILNTAAILRDEDDYLQSITGAFYESAVSEAHFDSDVVIPEITIKTDNLKEMHPAIGKRVVEKVFWQIGSPPSYRSIEGVLKMTHTGKTGLEHHYANGLKIYKTATEIIFSRDTTGSNTRTRSEQRFEEVLCIDKTGQYHIPSLQRCLRISHQPTCNAGSGQNLIVDAEKLSFPLTVRAAHPGERFIPLGAPGGKKVMRFLSDKKIPKHRRYTFPVLVAGETVIAVLGLAIADSVKITHETRRCLLIQWKEVDSCL